MIPYGECVTNKDIRVSQCTILWHLDNLKITNVYPKVVDIIIDMLKNNWKEAPLTDNQGKLDNYLVMKIYFNIREMLIRINNYIKKVLKSAREGKTII